MGVGGGWWCGDVLVCDVVVCLWCWCVPVHQYVAAIDPAAPVLPPPVPLHSPAPPAPETRLVEVAVGVVAAAGRAEKT